MTLAQALPSLWIMVGSAYLLIAVPATFLASLLSFALTFSAAGKRRSVRGMCIVTLLASIINAAVVIFLLDVDQSPLSSGAPDRFLMVIMITTVVFSVLGLWRLNTVNIVTSTFLAFGMLLSSSTEACCKGTQTKVLSDTKQTMVALELYANDHHGKLPRGLGELIPNYLTHDHCCPN